MAGLPPSHLRSRVPPRTSRPGLAENRGSQCQIDEPGGCCGRSTTPGGPQPSSRAPPPAPPAGGPAAGDLERDVRGVVAGAGSRGRSSVTGDPAASPIACSSRWRGVGVIGPIVGAWKMEPRRAPARHRPGSGEPRGHLRGLRESASPTTSLLDHVRRIDDEVEEGDVPGVVVSRVDLSPRFMRELLDAMNDSSSKPESEGGHQGPSRVRALKARASRSARRRRMRSEPSVTQRGEVGCQRAS